MQPHSAHPNRLGIWGWFGGGRWGLDRYLFSLHRLTGLGLLAYFILHIVLTSSRALGESAWKNAMAQVEGPFFTLGEYLVFFAFAFHAINGVRLLLLELGILAGQPEEPIYPYRTSVQRQRPLALGVMILAALVILLGGWDFFVLR
jgi:succinate dehydrogenase / fumarate reductase cytochrome b subunit